MSENEKALGFENASEPGSQEPAPQEQESQEQPQYLTREEVQSLLDAQKDELLRQTQSLTDKASSRLDKKLRDELKKVDEVIALQKAAGLQITPVQESALRAQVYDKALKELGTEEGSDSAPAAQQGFQDDPSQAAQKAAAAVINGMAEEIYKKAGIMVMPDDPEASMVDQSSPVAFLTTLQQAVEKKKQRVQTAPEARITSLGRGQQPNTNLEAQYLEEKKKYQGDVNALIELKKKYRAKGLQI